MVATPSATPRPRKVLVWPTILAWHTTVLASFRTIINDLFGLQHVLKNCYYYTNYYIIVNTLLNDFERLTNYFDDDVPDDTIKLVISSFIPVSLSLSCHNGKV